MLVFAAGIFSVAFGGDPVQWSGGWTESRSGGIATWFEISGTGGRNNPLRRKLATPFTGDELFVRFQLRYDAESIDTPADGNGEFLVLWLDEEDGGDRAVHSGGVPNVGLHVDGDHNAFMVRYVSSSQSFAKTRLEGDRVYSLIARLSRSRSASDATFDRLSLWIDPKITDVDKPAVETRSAKAIRSVNWIGFSTGMKTEAGDRISVSDISIATNWLGTFGLDLETEPTEPAPPSEVPTVDQTPAQTVRFDTQVLPIFERRCFSCHQGDSPDSGLRLDSYDEILNQVAPRQADASHLISLVEETDADKRMPPADESGPLSDEEIDVLRRWIDEGVAWDHDRLPTPTPTSDHWAFQALSKPEIPNVKSSARLKTPIDAFIIRRQERLGITPAEPASWPTLRRRVALDLTGLPPSEFPESQTIDSDDELSAWIDQLLGSNEYAERWGRFWLDLARWAESNGHQHNRPRPHAWRYRDYVIESFRSDKPYDQFIREQIAGDELSADQQRLEATGFLAAARYSGNELDKDIQRNDILVDVVNTTAKTFLGVTMECAQCHTHKFDPFTIRDYYRLQAFFTQGQPSNLLLSDSSDEAESWVKARWQIFDSVHARLVKRKRESGVPEPVLVIPKSVIAAMNSRERAALRDLDDAIKDLPQVWGWSGADSETTKTPHEMRWPLPRDRGSLTHLKTYLRLRGDVKSVGPEVAPGWPAVFGPTPGNVHTRTDLAKWIASPDHPLTARVWVNRIWQWHFGTGLVPTSGDFGTQGAEPTHPELLDWLACELVESGWSTRHIHRLILDSSTYRQSATFSQPNHDVDPECQTLWRWTPRRLEAEAIRDCIVSVAGKIEKTVGGPSVTDAADQSSFRRSVYLQQQRERLAESLTLFDSPPAVTTCSRRRVSTVALQPLYLLNSEFMQAMSRSLAERVRDAAKEDRYAETVVQLALGRNATAAEIERLDAYLTDHSLESLCLAVMNLNEFLYLN